MIKFHVQAVERQGFKGCSRAGRFWPSGEAIEVALHDQEDDPPCNPGPDGKRSIHNEVPRNLGKRSFELLRSDRRLRIINAGDPLRLETDEVSNLRARFDKEWASLKDTHAAELAHLHEAYDLTIKRIEAERDEAVLRAEKAEAEVVELLDKGPPDLTTDDPGMKGEITKVDGPPKAKGGKKGKGEGGAD